MAKIKDGKQLILKTKSKKDRPVNIGDTIPSLKYYINTAGVTISSEIKNAKLVEILQFFGRREAIRVEYKDETGEDALKTIYVDTIAKI